jgi:hypothetical protein
MTRCPNLLSHYLRLGLLASQAILVVHEPPLHRVKVEGAKQGNNIAVRKKLIRNAFVEGAE